MGILNSEACDRCNRIISEDQFLCKRCEERALYEGRVAVMEVQNDVEEENGKLVKLKGC